MDPGLILLKPPFGSERLDVVSPNLGIPVDGVAGYAQDCTLGEELSRNVQAAFGSDAREAHGRGGVQPKGFVDDCFEVGEPLDDFRGCDRVVVVSESFIEFGLEFRLGIGVQGQVVGDGTR